MSSSDSDEDFVSYGTPLEPLEEDTIPKKRAVGVEDQVAKDKHGRRRFHGAFTGGFSAGFFNTVGSLEGWKPTQFKSSRSSKFTHTHQKPEDFMDEEDMDEFGIAPKTLGPTENYKQNKGGSNRKRLLVNNSLENRIPGIPVLETIFQPVRETIGIKLLMKMGWKPGQGVGPRLSRAEKKVQKKYYGCSLPDRENLNKEDTFEDDSDDDIEQNLTFAPDDFETNLVKPKDNLFGLGYSGLERRPVLSSSINLFEPVTSSLVMTEKTKKVSIRGQAFGVGAFENDDEDIYAKDDMSQYDFALDTPQMLADKRRKQRNETKNKASPSGTGVLEGFVLQPAEVVRKRYAPPVLPPGYAGLHQTRQSRFSGVDTPAPVDNRPRLTAAERAILVSVEPTPQVKAKLNPCKNQGVSQEQEKTDNTESIHKPSVSGVGGFRPFVADPEKQQRYETFLSAPKTEQSEKLKSVQPVTMTEWERERERAEFEQAARLYRPLSAAFSDRFVSASRPDDATNPLTPVTRTATADDGPVAAARLKMYGHLTRRVTEWQPHSVLCKRFNIPQPRVNDSSKPKPTRPKFSVFNFLDAAPLNHMPAAAGVDDGAVDIPTTSQTGKPADQIPEAEPLANNPVSSLSSVDKKPEDNEIKTSTDVQMDELEQRTNKLDLYKAIFLSSSEESDNNDNETEVKNLPIQKQSASELNVLRNTSPPRGIFANLNFDALNSKENKLHLASSNNKSSETTSNNSSQTTSLRNEDNIKRNIVDTHIIEASATSASNEKEASSENTNLSEVYGPILPKQISKVNVVTIDESSSSGSEDEWVELKDSTDKVSKKHSPKKHKSKRKTKEKRAKKKKKHKHRKKEY